LLTSRNSANLDHAICIVSNQKDGFKGVSSPAGEEILTQNDISQKWHGEAILISLTFSRRIIQEWYILGTILVVFLIPLFNFSKVFCHFLIKQYLVTRLLQICFTLKNTIQN
jgi:hypothetical protein